MFPHFNLANTISLQSYHIKVLMYEGGKAKVYVPQLRFNSHHSSIALH
jgi:hypothetical protein